MKPGEKAWKKKLQAIEIKHNSKILKDEFEKLENSKEAYLWIFGPGYVFTQISFGNFLKIKAESLGNGQIYGKLDAKIKNLWKMFYISSVFWVIILFVLVNFAVKIITKH